MIPVATLTLNDGNKVPWIAFGTGTALARKDAQQPVALAIQNGFTHLDTAQMYENEGSVGAAIAASGKPRSELYATTKLGLLQGEATPKSALEISLRKLGLTYVNLYLVHHPKSHAGKLKEFGKEWKKPRMLAPPSPSVFPILPLTISRKYSKLRLFPLLSIRCSVVQY